MEYTLKNGAKVVIRHPDAEDAQGIISVISTADTESRFCAREPGEFQYTVEREREIIAYRTNSPDEAWFVAEYDGKLVGDGSVCRVGTKSRFRNRAKVGFIILNAYCGLGKGGKLMLECIGWCKEHGITQLELDVVTTNERAIRMYEGFGFEPVGTMPHPPR